MKFSISWLKDYLDTSASLTDITDTLNRIGLEVEGVISPAEKLAPFRVAEVLEAKPHPDADKLKICTVNTGTNTVQIVCGAPNARKGIKVVLGQPGDYVPGLDVTLKKAKIRGVESLGMMCSARELELGEDHDGIIELAADAPVGTSFVDYAKLDDPVIEIAITPNRQDCLGIYGIARDLAAAGLGTLKPITVPAIGETIPALITPATETEACSYFLARSFTGLKNTESPDWLKARLESVGQKSISALVDVTNYINMAYGRPLHVYDAAKVTGTLTARTADAGQTFTALDDKNYTTKGGETIICDESGLQGFGGVIGGKASSVSIETTDVILEAALFDAISVATCGREHILNTDARYRFERGVDSGFVRTGLDLASRMILDLCGGAASPVTQGGSTPVWSKTVNFRPERVATLGGLEIDQAHVKDILSRLGFNAQETGPVWTVAVPSWRTDVDGEADIVEEVLRIYGVDAVPSVALPNIGHKAGQTLSLRQKRARTARRTLAARGLFEAVTWSFMKQRDAALFGGGRSDLLVDNPISSELDCMRPSILPSLALAAQRNRDRGAVSVSLFEVGPVYESASEKGQLLAASGLRAFNTGGRHWRASTDPVSIYDIKADAEAVLESLGASLDTLQVFDEAPTYFHPGRSGTLRLGPKNILAHFGELHPKILKAMDLDGPMVGMEVFVERLPFKKKKSTAKDVLKASNLQSVERDFAFIVKSDVRAQELLRAVRGADKNLITNVSVFDVYQGLGVEDGFKSLAIRVTLTPLDMTFTDKDIERLSMKIENTAEKSVGARLRR